MVHVTWLYNILLNTTWYSKDTLTLNPMHWSPGLVLTSNLTINPTHSGVVGGA